MDSPTRETSYSNPFSALLVSFQRIANFITEQRQSAKSENEAKPRTVGEAPRYWTSMPLRRAIFALPLLPTTLDPSSLHLSPRSPLSPVFINLDHVRVFAGAGFMTGFLVGAYSGGKLRRLQFLAENSHRLPKTKAGWYYYLRERNYQVLKRGGAVGAKVGLKWAGVLGGFAAIETVVDILRAAMTPVREDMAGEEGAGSDLEDLLPPSATEELAAWAKKQLLFVGPGSDPEDWKSTAIAGITAQALFSRLYELRTTPRTFLLGLTAFSLLGLAQDAFRSYYNESSKYTFAEIMAPDDAEDPVAAARRKKEEEERKKKEKGEEDRGGKSSWQWPWAPKEVGAIGRKG